jgi:hypothetical protein
MGIIAALLMAAPAAWAGIELIVIERPFHARHLAGVVVDTTGEVVSGAVVEERDPTFNRVLASTTTDANGHFAFQDAHFGVTYQLKARAKGFNPIQITVRLRHFARAELRIKLWIAT